jgi:mono/diheme cytochrome c family protein
MRVIPKIVAIAFVGAVVIVGGLLAYVRVTGLKSQPEPGALETRVARAVRSVAVPSAEKSRVNPLAGSKDAASEGLQHFAKYCAMCHANNGSGEKTAIGHGLFPKPPDLRAAATQQLTDGELFYIIENGVRFTGMPSFGGTVRTDAGERQTWQLVTFVRHLPSITAAEVGWMESLNPL